MPNNNPRHLRSTSNCGLEPDPDFPEIRIGNDPPLFPRLLASVPSPTMNRYHYHLYHRDEDEQQSSTMDRHLDPDFPNIRIGNHPPLFSSSMPPVPVLRRSDYNVAAIQRPDSKVAESSSLDVNSVAALGTSRVLNSKPPSALARKKVNLRSFRVVLRLNSVLFKRPYNDENVEDLPPSKRQRKSDTEDVCIAKGLSRIADCLEKIGEEARMDRWQILRDELKNIILDLKSI